jgi:hypothetical protein
MAITQIEKDCFDCVDENINLSIPWYLMACYAYYVEDNPILEDASFDRLTKKILKDWDNIEHIHKPYLTKDMLEAGTFLGEYPSRVQGAVQSVRKSYK